MTGFTVSIAALILGEILASVYARRFQERIFLVLREDVPRRSIRTSFTEQSFRRSIEALIISVVGIPTLMLTLSAYDSDENLRPLVGHGVLEIVAVVGTLCFAAYGWVYPRPTMDDHRVFGFMSISTFVLVILNGVGIIALVASA